LKKIIYKHIKEQQSTTLLLVFVLPSRRHKTFVTVGTTERKLVSMLVDLVSIYAARLGELFSTDIAQVWLLSGMFSLVLFQIAILSETYATINAVEGLLLLVDRTLVYL